MFGAVVAHRTVVALLLACVRGGVDQQRGVALRDHGERGGDVGLRHVVLAHVVLDDVAEPVDPGGLLQRRRDGVVEAGQPGRVDVVGGRQLHLGERLSGRLLDVLEQVALARRHEGDRVPAATRAAGAADAVHVGLGVGGAVSYTHLTLPTN